MTGWVFDCPLCSPGAGSYKLGLIGTHANCWTCGPQSMPWMLHLISGRSYKEVKTLLEGLDRGLPPEIRPRGTYKPPAGVGPLLKPHRKYLQGRGLDPDELAAVWDVQGIGLSSRLPWRVFIPIHHRGKAVSWTTRAINDKGLRYISASPDEEAIPKGELLFGEDLAGHAVVVVEGPLDVFRIGPGALGTLGVSYSQAQVQRLSKFPVRYVCMDNEPAAQRRARKLCRELSGYNGPTTNLVLESGKDPGAAKEWEVNEIRRMLR